jgi:ribosomal protein S18 acetylase RimI-like enzyme
MFPSWAPLNNAIMLSAPESAVAAATASELASSYAEAGVAEWAFWVPSRALDLDAPDEVRDVGRLKRDTTTLVMQTSLSPGFRRHEGVVRASIRAATRAGDEPVPATDLGEPETGSGLTAWVMVQDGYAVAGVWSFLHERDCGIYALGTVTEWRRRGLARALMGHVLADAQHRGGRTATLQSTRMGLPLYQSLGFEPAGRYEEWISQ